MTGPTRPASAIVGAMNDQPDFSALAREYLDLWEDQLTAMAADPALAEQGARLFETMGQLGNQVSPLAGAQMTAMMQQFMALAGAMGEGTSRHATATPKQPKTGPTAGSAPAAAAPDDGDQQLDELTRRLAALEERLARLESGASATGGKPRAKTRRAGTTAKKPGKTKSR